VKKIQVGIILAILICIAIVIGTSGVAKASNYTNICGNGGSGYCLNDWNGNTNNGAAIKMYYGNYYNDRWAIAFVYACHDGTGAHNTIQSDCLGDWGTNNSFLIGAGIVEIYDQNVGGVCLATNSSGYAVIGTCPSTADGTGGSIGTLMAILGGSGCTAGYQQFLSDRYWDHLINNGTSFDLQSGGNIGVQAHFEGGVSSTCWGWVGGS